MGRVIFTDDQLKQCKQHAKLGVTESQYQLGCYYRDEGQLAKGYEWLKKAASNGYSAAQKELDNNEWHELKAKQGDVESQYKTGCVCYEEGKLSKAFGWFEKAAKQGHGKAAHKLGLCYNFGWGCKVNIKKALSWYSAACNAGIAEAYCDWGVLFINGTDGVVQNSLTALSMFSNAAALGCARGNYCTAQYCEAEGAYLKALENYQQALKNGYEQAEEDVKRLKKIVAEEESKRQSSSVKSTSSSRNYAKSQSQKTSDTQSTQTTVSAEWQSLLDKAELGDVEAQYNIGSDYYHGKGVKKDYVEAVYWLSRATALKNAKAQCLLGDCYRMGLGVETNVSMARALYSMSAEQGNAKAKKILKEHFKE